MEKIYYDIKQTTANTQYLSIQPDDLATINNNVIGIISYMSELSVSSKQDHKDFIKWYTRSNKRYLYNKKLKRSNSPQSFLAGIINNLVFGDQRDYSLLQLETIQDITNTAIDIIDATEKAYKIDLQTKPQLTKIFIQENLWEM